MRVLVAAAFLVISSVSHANVDQSVQDALEKTMPRFACNLSPTKWKKKLERVVDGKPQTIEMTAASGSIIAAPHVSDPDYFFHWSRDSALVVDSLVRYIDFVPGTSKEAWLHNFIRNFTLFSARLQASASVYGIGEVRFNVDGSVDSIPWSRPQNDGPALRALSLLHYYERYGYRLDADFKTTLLKVVIKDIEYVAQSAGEKSFDLWEYSLGFHFYTRLVQLGALEEGIRLLPLKAVPSWYRAIKNLKTALKDHWNTEKEFYSFSAGPVFDQPGNPVGQPGGGLDSSAILAALHSRRLAETFSLRDDRLQFTVWKLENYFRNHFPVNHGAAEQRGPAIGRHEGDGYYGGNAWYFLTAGFGEYFYRLAAYYSSHQKQTLLVTRYNRELFEETIGRHLSEGENLMSDVAHRNLLVAKLIAKGDAFISTVIKYIPSDGMMAEQFSKVDGLSISASDLTWSYSAFLGAVLARPKRFKIDYTRIDMSCRN
jgi:glucoamylase